MNKILHIVETAYRATLQEQDDPALWMVQSLRNNDTDSLVRLQGNAVGYALRAQDARGLEFGARKQTQPPQLQEDLLRLRSSGARVFVVEEHLKSRGIKRNELIEDIDVVPEEALPSLFNDHDYVFQW